MDEVTRIAVEFIALAAQRIEEITQATGTAEEKREAYQMAVSNIIMALEESGIVPELSPEMRAFAETISVAAVEEAVKCQ
ncbi:hypothetical protein [Paenibacillus sp. YN15]|uniref:hypothetical protein n=1 Tax=Paenibacillus sp. YN15 TaxID=1742774 RepID=UPI000DCE4D96|nr:hypothetical protein [Paenibacillus sp. YN15]RAV03040.1 hypothetical protein DQG13_08250 [Paenibacillus sp. YN15]